MKKLVVLLTEESRAPAIELINSLRTAGISVLVRDARAFGSAADISIQPHALLYQLEPETTPEDLKAIIQFKEDSWPEAPIVACRDQQSTRMPACCDKTALQRLGFLAIADCTAQLPALLRHIEDAPTGELKLPRLDGESETYRFALPPTVRREQTHEAAALLGSLHLVSTQEEAAQTALDGIAKLVRANRWSILLTGQANRPDSVTLEPLMSQPSAAELMSQPSAAEEEQPKIVASRSARDAAIRMEAIRRVENDARVLAVPLVAADRVMGVLEGIRKDPARAFTKTETALLASLATPIASALTNSVRIADAERLSLTDDLTKLNNARYLRQFLVNEIKRARRHRSYVAAVFIDLDDFKRVNDQHGHLVGSHVLMEIAAAVLPSVRDTDCVVRYGGDEFVVILPESGIEEAVQVADRIRAKLAGHVFTGGRRLRIALTASFGVAVFADHASSPQQLIRAADLAMYDAKAAGKNCVRVASAIGAEFDPQFQNLSAPQHFQKIPGEKLVS